MYQNYKLPTTMKKLFFIGLLLVMSQLLQAQVIRNEEFSNNNEGWSTGATGDYSLKFQDGEYQFEHFNASGSWLSWDGFTIDTSKDFEIVTKIRKVSGPQNSGYGIVWGLDDVNNSFTFSLTPANS